MAAMTVVALTPQPTTGLVRGLSLTAKAGLLLLLLSALLHPDLGNMRDKAAWVRAVAYPLLAFTVPALWFAFWRDRSPFPWVADLLVTVTCFSDILGNRLDLYDTVVWFDDWMHLANTGLIAAAVLLLTLPATASLVACLERALALGCHCCRRVGDLGVRRVPQPLFGASERVRRHPRRSGRRGAGRHYRGRHRPRPPNTRPTEARSPHGLRQKFVRGVTQERSGPRPFV
jgi:hypothetical protein